MWMFSIFSRVNSRRLSSTLSREWATVSISPVCLFIGHFNVKRLIVSSSSVIYLHCLYIFCLLFALLSESILLLERCQLHVMLVNELRTICLLWFNNVCHIYSHNSKHLKQLQEYDTLMGVGVREKTACSKQDHKAPDVMNLDKNCNLSTADLALLLVASGQYSWVKQVSDQPSSALTHDLSPVWLCSAAFFSV